VLELRWSVRLSTACRWHPSGICRCVSAWQSYTPPIRGQQEPMGILPGKRLGPYEIFSAIGAGDSVGVVCKAGDIRLYC
jgi:hypothetical protein